MLGAAEAQESLLSRTAQSGLLWCGIVDGRVTLDAARLSNVHSVTNNGRGKETLDIRNENGQPSIRYEETNSERQITMEIAAGGRLTIRRTPRGSSKILPMEFNQAAGEKVTLTLGSGTGQQVFRTRAFGCC